MPAIFRTVLSFAVVLALLSPAVSQDKQATKSKAATDQTAPRTEKDSFHLFLLVGQSNMAGRGLVSDADKQPLPNIQMLNKQKQWVPATHPMHFDKSQAGVGLGRTFAREILKANPSVTIGLIPCAVGGSSIAVWEPGGKHTKTNTHPYDDTLVRLQAAMKDGMLKGILWHQGESDSKPASSKAYEARLHTLIRRLRAESGDKNVPFIVGQLGQFPERPWDENRKRVDQAHRAVPDKIENTAFVPSDGLKHKGDNTHFSTEAYKELGKRYAKAYLSLIKQTSKQTVGAK